MLRGWGGSSWTGFSREPWVIITERPCGSGLLCVSGRRLSCGPWPTCWRRHSPLALPCRRAENRRTVPTHRMLPDTHLTHHVYQWQDAVHPCPKRQMVPHWLPEGVRDRVLITVAGWLPPRRGIQARIGGFSTRIFWGGQATGLDRSRQNSPVF